ncbi:hypothetical protein GmHk_13G038912 [Glycine max]|nr:hypothetical protein GmHk_13G038912 [Glycine max]
MDANWFETTIFTNKTSPPFHSALDSTPESHVKEVLTIDSKLLISVPTLQVRSFSDQNLGSSIGVFSDFPSPNSVLTPQKLRPILSGKEVEDFPEEEDKDSRSVSLIPGLQRLGKEDDGRNSEQNIDETVICRPYLSETWDVLDQRKVVNPLLNLRVPVVGNEIGMKDNLRFWAHTVASIVKH